jgi:hypothetical protein
MEFTQAVELEILRGFFIYGLTLAQGYIGWFAYYYEDEHAAAAYLFTTSLLILTIGVL